MQEILGIFWDTRRLGRFFPLSQLWGSYPNRYKAPIAGKHTTLCREPGSVNCREVAAITHWTQRWTWTGSQGPVLPLETTVCFFSCGCDGVHRGKQPRGERFIWLRAQGSLPSWIRLHCTAVKQQETGTEGKRASVFRSLTLHSPGSTAEGSALPCHTSENKSKVTPTNEPRDASPTWF